MNVIVDFENVKKVFGVFFGAVLFDIPVHGGVQFEPV
jgi:hypothetical protein